jgi:probable HAF family extracellular repeat protein
MKHLLAGALALTVLIAPMMSTAQSDTTPFFMALPPEALPQDVGAGGWTIVGSLFSGGAFYWTPSEGRTAIGGTTAASITRDGTRIVGNALDGHGIENAAIWTGGTSWQMLGSFSANAQPCDQLLSHAYGASDDGRVIVGLGWDGCRYAHAFRWEQSTGVVDLGSTNARSTRANGGSGDGAVIVGWQEDPVGLRVGAKWIDRAQTIFQGPNGIVSEAFGANRDGSIIVGKVCDFAATVDLPSAWTWTADKGVTCFPVSRPSWLPPLPYLAAMLATSDDGRVIVGAYTFGLDSEALLWLDGQVFFLKDYLQQHGLPDAFRGWVNTGFLTSVTPDGRTLAGYGAGPTTFQGYMVVLPDRGKR